MVLALLLNLLGMYQKMRGIMAWGKSSEKFSILIIANSTPSDTWIWLVSLRHIDSLSTYLYRISSTMWSTMVTVKVITTRRVCSIFSRIYESSFWNICSEDFSSTKSCLDRAFIFALVLEQQMNVMTQIGTSRTNTMSDPTQYSSLHLMYSRKDKTVSKMIARIMSTEMTRNVTLRRRMLRLLTVASDLRKTTTKAQASKKQEYISIDMIIKCVLQNSSTIRYSENITKVVRKFISKGTISKVSRLCSRLKVLQHDQKASDEINRLEQNVTYCLPNYLYCYRMQRPKVSRHQSNIHVIQSPNQSAGLHTFIRFITKLIIAQQNQQIFYAFQAPQSLDIY